MPGSYAYRWDGEDRTVDVAAPTDYLVGIGAVITNWSKFEQLLDVYLELLRLAPEVQALGDVPTSFAKRANRLKRSVRACFPTCPTFHAMVDSVADRATAVCRQRNRVTHCFWQHDADGKVVMASKPARSGETYTATPDELLELASRAGALEVELIKLFVLFSTPGFLETSSLPSHEISELQEYGNRHRRYLDGSIHAAPQFPPQPLLG